MNKRISLICLFALTASCGYSEDLLQVYSQSKANAPILSSYAATNQAASDAFSSTRGVLLPRLDLTASAGIGQYTPSSGGGDTFTYQSGALALSQQVFDLNLWGLTLQADDVKDAAEATYQGNLQSFTLTVAKDYFNILQDQDNLISDSVADSFYKRTYQQTKQKFDAGLGTIKDVKQAEANYDLQRATTIADKAQLHIDVSQLARFTNKRYKSLAAPMDKFPYVKPKPADIKWWVARAEKGNYTLQAARLNSEAARQDVVATVGDQLPKFSVVGTYGVARYQTNNATLAVLNSGSRTLQNWTVALKATWSIFGGGANFASSLQAGSEYSSDEQQTLQVYRNVKTQTRQDYRTVVSDVYKVHALMTAVDADKTALKQLDEKCHVGTVTTVDVLDAAQQLFLDWRAMTKVQYKYINDLLTLHADTGSLKLSNLRELNKWLGTQKPTLPDVI